MNAVAGKHFNRGQRAFFFSLAYLGWFVSAYLFIVATAGVLYRDVAPSIRVGCPRRSDEAGHA